MPKTILCTQLTTIYTQKTTRLNQKSMNLTEPWDRILNLSNNQGLALKRKKKKPLHPPNHDQYPQVYKTKDNRNLHQLLS